MKLTSRRNLLTSSRNANDNTLASAAMADFEGGSHGMDVACTIEGEVASALCHFD